MKRLLALLLWFGFGSVVPVVQAVQVGETAAQLLKEKGEPKSQIAAGDTQVFIYADLSVEVRQGRVTSIEKLTPTHATAPRPSAAPAPALPINSADPLAAKKAQLQATLARVEAIINQPVEPVAHATSRPANYPLWFHPGAIIPDFDHVDICQTQQPDYDKSAFITSPLHPGLIFHGADCEFNPMTKLFYTDRTVPKKKLTEDEMLELNRLYRTLGQLRRDLGMDRPQ